MTISIDLRIVDVLVQRSFDSFHRKNLTQEELAPLVALGASQVEVGRQPVEVGNSSIGQVMKREFGCPIAL
jgi:hypothetical protein